MKVIKPSFKLESEVVPHLIFDFLERIGRTCYKSEQSGESEKFIQKIIDSGHEAMIEHKYITVRFIHNRGFSHELVRHRIANFAQESTRYCNYSKDKFDRELTFIEPYWYAAGKHPETMIWLETMKSIEKAYIEMTASGLPAQAARGVLPNDLKTEIVMTANLREWRHVFKLRCASDAHPDMRMIMIPLKEKLASILPVVFGEKE